MLFQNSPHLSPSLKKPEMFNWRGSLWFRCSWLRQKISLALNPLLHLLRVMFILQHVNFISDSFRVSVESRAVEAWNKILPSSYFSFTRWMVMPVFLACCFYRFVYVMAIHAPCHQTWATKPDGYWRFYQDRREWCFSGISHINPAKTIWVILFSCNQLNTSPVSRNCCRVKTFDGTPNF